MIDSAYTNPDMMVALYNDPANEVLLTAYLFETAGVQLGAISANLGAIGPATGDPGVTGTGGDPGGGTGCFAGETLYTLFTGEQITMAELYDNRRKVYIGKGCRAFTPDKDQHIVPGEIRDVYKRTVYELLHVEFEGEKGVLRLVPEHRFWLRNRTYKPMHSIRRNYHLQTYDTPEWGETRVADRKLVKYPEGVDVYNCLIGIWHNYFVTQSGGRPKAVSNVKPIEGGGG